MFSSVPELEPTQTVTKETLNGLDAHSTGYLVWTNNKFVRCEDEPIHIPGKIQSFGALLAISKDSWDIRMASENCLDILGIDVRLLLAASSLKEFLDPDQIELLQDNISRMPADPLESGPDIMNLRFKNNSQVFCIYHCSSQNPGLIILEFEDPNDSKYPCNNAVEVEPCSPDHSPPEDVVLREEIRKTITSVKDPFDTVAGVLCLLNKLQIFIDRATTVKDLADVVSTLVRELTAFERVMVYEFDPDWNGQVIAESRGNKNFPSFLGLHFPHTDIPAQARKLYEMNKIRSLYSRSLPCSRIFCKSLENLEHPLDLSHSALRAISPIHLQYLKNMDVESSLSIAINIDDSLWGLIACHGSVPRRMNTNGRLLLQYLGLSLSEALKSLIYVAKQREHKVISNEILLELKQESLANRAEGLLELLDADSAVLKIEDQVKIFGSVPTKHVEDFMEYMKIVDPSEILHTNAIHSIWPNYPHEIANVAGFFIIPLSKVNDYLVFFRKESVHNVAWAGKDDKSSKSPEEMLTPRLSFERWTELVSGTSEKWKSDHIKIAQVLQLVYWRFINIWREREKAVKNSRLKNVLLSNVSHEVRTPLNSIINYLEAALEERELDPELRAALSESHKAGKALIFIINDLLDLTRIEAGQVLFKTEPFDILSTVIDAAKMFKMDAKKNGIFFEINAKKDIPMVVGDAHKIRQIVINLCCNALKFTVSGYVKVYLTVLQKTSTQVTLELAVQDTGIGIPKEKLAVIFQDFEQVETELSRKTEGAGLGLAIVARIIRNMNGQLAVESTCGKGSRFAAILTFPLAELYTPMQNSSETTTPDKSQLRRHDSILRFVEGESMVIEKQLRSSNLQVQQQPDATKTSVPSSPSLAKPATEERKVPQSFKVLYAEDDLVNQKILERRLSKLGYIVVVCDNGNECVEIFSQNPSEFDFILMDVQMPICDGLLATERIRALEASRGAGQNNLPLAHRLNGNRIPIVAISARVYEADINRCRQVGMDGFICKPVNLPLLNDVLQSSRDHEARSLLRMDSQFNVNEGYWF